MATKEGIDRALRWLDLRYQHKGDFATAGKIQSGHPSWRGVAVLLADYAEENDNAQ
jgi:hypothetical protein